MHLRELKAKSPLELLHLAESLEVEHASSLKRHDLTLAILKKKSEQEIVLMADGVLEILPDGFGFLRSSVGNYLPAADDLYVSPQQIRNHHLRTGDSIEGIILPPKEGERYFTLSKILNLNCKPFSKTNHRLPFDNLTPIFPNRKLELESFMLPDTASRTKDMTLRMAELVAPLGFGQRALIVAPPRTGKTVLLQRLIQAVMHNHPECHLMILLIDERPEEVTEMKRIVKRGEVISSTFDEPASRHIQVAEMVIERAKRLVESKQDVIVFLDSITRLARAYNTVMPSSGKVLTGGVDSGALQRPKRLFGAARNMEEGGSLTIIGTTLVDTGSRMDEVIFEEFKGTGNSEIILDRRLADKRTFPAIDVTRSGTRKEELLVEPAILQKLWVLRRVVSSMGPTEATDFLLDKLRQTKTNAEFFDTMNRPLT